MVSVVACNNDNDKNNQNTLLVYYSKVVVCSCLEELHQRIDTSQLTSELGGSLFYSHQEWIDTRMVIRLA